MNECERKKCTVGESSFLQLTAVWRQFVVFICHFLWGVYFMAGNLVEDITTLVMGFCLLWPCDLVLSPPCWLTPITVKSFTHWVGWEILLVWKMPLFCCSGCEKSSKNILDFIAITVSQCTIRPLKQQSDIRDPLLGYQTCWHTNLRPKGIQQDLTQPD